MRPQSFIGYQSRESLDIGSVIFLDLDPDKVKILQLEASMEGLQLVSYK